MTSTAVLPDVALDALLCSMADDEFVIGFTDSEWTGIAPLLEEDVAMSSLSQDELGHAQALYGLLGERTGQDPDSIAYDRSPADYRHCRLLDHGRGDWAMTIARRYLYETADAIRLAALDGGSWAPLADLVGKLIREERYHLMHARTWFDRLAGTPDEPRDRLIAALDELGPDIVSVFTPLPDEALLVETGILSAPMADLAERWRAEIRPMYAAHGLTLPMVTVASDGRGPGHGPAFEQLHDDITLVRRSDPGATW